MKQKIGTHIAFAKTSNRIKGFCVATLHHGEIRDLVVRAFVQTITIMNFVSPARNEGKIPIMVHTYRTINYTINSNMHTNFQSQRLEQAIDIINSNTKSCTRILYRYEVYKGLWLE